MTCAIDSGLFLVKKEFSSCIIRLLSSINVLQDGVKLFYAIKKFISIRKRIFHF